MFADTLTLNPLGVFTKINDGLYSSEYRLRDAVQQITLKVKHSSFTPKGGLSTDRHAVEMTRVVFATVSVPSKSYKAYTVVELPTEGTLSFSSDVIETLSMFMADDAVQTKILNWES